MIETTPAKYAIVDGTVEEGSLDFLNGVSLPHCCLYVEPIQPGLIALAPYFVEAIPEAEAWLRDKALPWRVYLTSESSIRELQQHFRRYLWARTPEQERPILMRFYGPRNIWVLVEALTPRQLLFSINPIKQLGIHYGEEYHEGNFSSIRPTKAMNTRAERPSRLVPSHRQHNQLGRKARDNYLDTLSVFIEESAEKGRWDDSSRAESSRILAEDYSPFCQSLDIAGNRSVRTMMLILLKKSIIDLRCIPDD